MKDDITSFFDDLAVDRDTRIKSDPILEYEQRMRQLRISELLDVKPRDVVLDAGCGNLRDFGLFAAVSGIRYVAVDLSRKMALEGCKDCKSDVPRIVQGDVTRLPFKSSRFDFVLCSEVLEHVPNWQQAVSELKRVLKDEGHLVLSTPNSLSVYFPQKLYLDRRYGGSHPYDKWKNYLILRKELKELGFRIADARGACYLPGLIAYQKWAGKVVVRFLRPLAWLEQRVLSRAFTKYFGYVIIIKAISEAVRQR